VTATSRYVVEAGGDALIYGGQYVAMAAQTRHQGRYLGGRPPYGYRLADAGPHSNKAHAAWGRRAHRLEPDPHAAPVLEGCYRSWLGSG
jgi:hypothetical protein